MAEFDDSLLDDPAALQRADQELRWLATAGARVRQVDADADPGRTALREVDRPRAVITTGGEARLIRAVAEPTCPVPLLAWPRGGLPGWVGPLDLVVVGASDGGSPDLVHTVAESVRRGATMILVCPPDSPIAAAATGRGSVVLPAATSDPLAAAVVAMAALADIGLSPRLNPEGIAQALDQAATDCSPYASIAENPAKDLALALADAQPLIWGGSVLAARASRRIAEAMRSATGRAALAADAGELLPVLAAVGARDPFADPFTDDGGGDRRPALVMLDDGPAGFDGGSSVSDQSADERILRDGRQLAAIATEHDIRMTPITADRGTELERYVRLLQTGAYAARYLAVGLNLVGWSTG